MVKKNKQPKDYTSCSLADEDYDDDNPGVIREADGTLRATRPGEVQQILVGREAAITPDTSDEDEPRHRRQRSSAPADNAGRQASATGSGARIQRNPRPPADNAGTEGSVPTTTSTQGSSGSSKSRTPSTSKRRRWVPPNPATDAQEPQAKTPAKKTSKQGDSPTPAELAELEQKYTIAEARRLRDVPTTTWTDADFRKEIENFWENWRVLNAKKEGTTPKAWTEPWETHKCGKHLWARYQKYQSTFMARTASSQRIIVQTTTTAPADQPSTSTETASTEQSTSSVTTTEQSTTSGMTTTTTSATTTADTTGVSSTTDIDLSVPAEGEGAFGQMPELTASDLVLLYGSLDEEQHMEDLLSDKFQAMLNDTELAADQSTAEPTPRPADNAGTEGGTSTTEADNATAGAGTTGQAEVVPSIPPPPPGAPPAPRAASTSQSDSDARSRQHSTKRSHPHTADSRDPPAQRIRRHISVSPERLSPGIERHRRTRKDTDKPLSPILDPRVYKDSAALLTLRDTPFEQWTQEFRNADSEYLGYVNAHTVPWTYLPLEAYNHQPLRKAHHSLGELMLDDVLKEDERLPNRYVLGHSFGIDPKLHKMVTSATRQYLTFIALQQYWTIAPGVRVRVVGIGPTGYDLSDCKDYNTEFVDQSTAFARLARAADEAGKCLSIRLDMDNGAADFDLHDAAREVLRHIKFQKTTPIYLQEHQGGYGDLCGWLEEFPNTVISFDYWYLAHLETVVEDNTLAATPLYAKAIGLLQFCKLVPLENIVIQSGAYSPRGDATPRKPNEFLLAADVLQRITGTPAAVYIEQTAINAARVYRLSDELMDNIRRSPDTSQHQRCKREDLRRNIDAHILSLNLVAAAPAPRADQQDQEGSGRRSSLALPADNAGGQPGAGVQGLVVPSIAPRSHSASRSPRHRSPRDADGSGGRRARSPTKRDKKPSPKATDKTNVRKPKSIKSRSSSEEDSGTKTKAAKTKQRPEDPDRAKKGPKTPPEKRSRSRSRSSRRRSRSRSRSPTRPSSSGRSHHSSYRTESASRRSDSDRRRDDHRSSSRRHEDRHRDEQRKQRDISRENERQRYERLRDEDRRKRREQLRDKSPARDVPSTSRDAYKRRDKDDKDRSSRSSTKTPPPAVQSQVFVVPNPPKARAPIRAPSQETQESRASSRTSTSSQRTYTNRLRDRVMIPKAVATADNAGAPYKVIQRKQRPPADNAGTEAPLRRNTGEELLKPQPLPPLGIIRPTADEIEQHVEGFFSPEIDADSQLRGFYVRDFASNPVDPPQPDAFSVPPDEPWTPSQKCSCGEDVPPGFHLTIEQANYIPIRRWRAHAVFKGPGRDEKLNAVAKMKIYSLGHMILVSWVACLKSNKDDRAAHIIDFLYQVLQTYDEDEILALLLEFQPLMVVEATEEDKGSRSMWPAHKDLKPAAERWANCCPHAFRYIFDRLSGPLTWAPQWLQSDAVPEDCQNSVRDSMIAQAETVFNELRHVLYRQYGLRHIQAVLNFKDFCWKRFDNDPKRETHRNGVCVNVHTIVFAEDRVIAAFGTNLKDSVRMIPVPDGNRKEIRDAVLQYFPGPQVRRVVFWFGQSSIAEHDYDDYDRVILDLSHIYATYLGYLEQVVVLPPYVRINSVTWACLALHLHMEREDLLRFARVALYPVDLQYYERDQRLGTDADWPSTFGITEDGRYRTRTIAGRKRFLEDNHDLDLWKPSAKPTKKATTSAVPPAIDYSDVDREENADRAASPTRPKTSANTAATTKASAGPPAPPTMRDGRTTQPTASTIVPTNFGASTSAAVPNLEPINTAFSAFLQRQTEDFQALQRALFEQLANQQAAASTSQPADPKSRHKDQKSGHRK